MPDGIVLTKSSILEGLVITWAPGCSTGAVDYAIYEGMIGNWYSHAPVVCSDDGGDFREEIVASGGDRYFLVVPINPSNEGSYGKDSTRFERPVGSTVCVSTQATGGCP